MQEWLYPIGVVLLGYTVLGLTGFGSALVIVPLLAWQWPLPTVVALTLLMDVPASAFHSGLNWRQVQWRELGRLVPGLVGWDEAGVVSGQIMRMLPPVRISSPPLMVSETSGYSPVLVSMRPCFSSSANKGCKALVPMCLSRP